MIIINYFLKFKHYQLFIFFILSVILVPILSYFFSYYSVFIISILIFLVNIVWFYSIEKICLLQIINNSVSKFKHRLFITCLLLFLIYNLIMSYNIVFVLFKNYDNGFVSNSFKGTFFDPQYSFFMFLANIFIMLSIIFICMYLSKLILDSYHKRDTNFDEYLGLFFLFAMIPIGIWFIQPKVNKLYERYLAEKEQQNE